MKIVQTFWHGNNSLLDNSFGWMNPQYHLMSWALSCLSLKDNYQNIVLYTDSHGYEIFAEQLKLPYTDIIIQYDNLTCPEPHWAYPKSFPPIIPALYDMIESFSNSFFRKDGINKSFCRI